MEPCSTTSAEFAAYMRADYQRWDNLLIQIAPSAQVTSNTWVLRFLHQTTPCSLPPASCLLFPTNGRETLKLYGASQPKMKDAPWKLHGLCPAL